MKKIGILSLSFFMVFTLSLMSAKADSVPAIDFNSILPGYDFTNGSWSLGWEFNVNQPITVTSLGFYDDLKNDLIESNFRTIFDEAF